MHKEIKSGQQYKKKIHRPTSNVISRVCTELEGTTVAMALQYLRGASCRLPNKNREVGGKKYAPTKTFYDYR
jgi:hypothetical protein